MNPLTIAHTQIRRDPFGRYCLNDVHEAAVAAGNDYKRCQTEHWLRLVSTRELIDLLRAESKSGELEVVSEEIEPLVAAAGRYGGTYAVKELVYAYAMWISPSFHLHVIRAYDAMVQAQAPVAAVSTGACDHRADQMVSAERIFRSALRIGRAMRLRPRAAIERAAASALRNTGVDWQAEIGVDASEDPENSDDHMPAAHYWEGTGTVAVYIAERNIVNVDEVHRNAFNASNEPYLKSRIGRALVHLGWRQTRRFRLGDGHWSAEYRRGNRR